MSEYVHRIPLGQPTGASGAPEQEYGNSGSGFLNNALTVNNAAIIAIAGSSAKQVVSTLYGATVEQIGNSELEVALAKTGRVAGYLGMAAVNPYLAIGKVGVDLFVSGIQQAQNIQKINYDNEYKKATSGINTSLSNYYG